MYKSFKQWMLYRECGTSTGDVAGFSRIAIPLVTRTWMPNLVFDMEPTENYPTAKKKKRVKQQPQVKE